MKKYKLFGWAFVASMMTFSACANDAEEVLTQECEIKLTSEISPSRVTSLDYQSTQIVKGQQVGVTITGAKAAHNNVAWTVGDNGALTNTGDAVYYGDGTATITAYHPFNSDWNENTNYEFSVSTNQSSDAGYLNSDLLWAEATATKKEEAVGMTFTHIMAKINVRLSSSDIADLKGATICICGTNINAAFNPITGTISTTTSSIKEIEAGVTDVLAKTATAIIVPQKLATGTEFIKIKHGDNYYVYKIPAEKEYKSGHSYTYSLTLNVKTGLELKSVLINNWENETINETLDNEDNNNLVEITLTEPGTLSSKIAETDKYWITKLKVSGPINGTDIKYIREMAGKDYEGNSTIGSLENLDLSEADIIGGEYYAYYNEHLIAETNTIGDYMFYYSNLRKIILPTNITKIGNSSFCWCTKLTSVEFSNNVLEIGMSAFKFCHELKSIVIPNSVTTIATGAFNSTGLTFLSIPKAVEEIGSECFSGCKELLSVECFQDTPIKLEYNEFAGINAAAKLYVPNGSLDAYKASSWNKYFTDILEMD